MERGLYAAASAMMAQQTIQEAVAQNIANANTVGYKQDVPTFKALHGMALQRSSGGGSGGPQIGELGLGVAADQTYTDWQAGALASTGNPLDVSLSDAPASATRAFFAVSTPTGERYTRAGNFRLNSAGGLVTADGMAVLGSNNAPITVQGGSPSFDAHGNLKIGGKIVAQLKIVQGDPAQMRKEGGGLFSANAPGGLTPAANAVVVPGALEQSNVNSAQGLVQMITVTRSFDMAQRALMTQDDLLRHASNELGKL